ncbi:hypothetical protein DV735_g1989, partial [Chaetothyriales sp. CBS 134920]
MTSIIDKLASAPASFWTEPHEHHDPPVFQPTHYFFYGTLTQPEILSHILDLKAPPELVPASIEGYSLALWGQYKTLLDGPPCNIVEGFAYEVQTVEDEDKLEYYETNAYESAPCLITLKTAADQDPKIVQGRTFMYAGDAQALKEGRFDRASIIGMADEHEATTMHNNFSSRVN